MERFRGFGCFLSKAADADGTSLAEPNAAKEIHSDHFDGRRRRPDILTWLRETSFIFHSGGGGGVGGAKVTRNMRLNKVLVCLCVRLGSIKKQ